MTNGMQIGKESIQNLLLNMVLEKKNFLKTQIQKYTIPCIFTWEWAKQIRVWNCPIHNDNDLWNLKFSDLN
jgi:hypothetical protein